MTWLQCRRRNRGRVGYRDHVRVSGKPIDSFVRTDKAGRHWGNFPCARCESDRASHPCPPRSSDGERARRDQKRGDGLMERARVVVPRDHQADLTVIAHRRRLPATARGRTAAPALRFAPARGWWCRGPSGRPDDHGARTAGACQRPRAAGRQRQRSRAAVSARVGGGAARSSGRPDDHGARTVGSDRAPPLRGRLVCAPGEGARVVVAGPSGAVDTGVKLPTTAV